MAAKTEWKEICDPQKNPDHQSQIIFRLRYMRVMILGVSQEKLSDECILTRAVYANYEAGRTILPCGIALKICRQLIISEKWLATGHGNPRPCVGLLTHFSGDQEHLQKPFTEMFSDYLEPLFASLDSKPFQEIIENLLREELNFYLLSNLYSYLKSCVTRICPPEISNEIEDQVLMRSSKFLADILKSCEKDPRIRANYRFDPYTGAMSIKEKNRILARSLNYS